MATKRILGSIVIFSLLMGIFLTTARREKGAAKVSNLPGQPRVNFSHYASYVKISEHKALFYWFFEAATNSSQKPLVLWLNGGPGCSSVGYGATEEIGPFIINDNGTGFSLNEYSWNNEANLLFVESPVGVGFSYSSKSSDYTRLGDNITAEDSYQFLQKWLGIFPHYRTHDFYITGESYAGKYVPQLAELVHDKNKISSKSRYINLKGFMVGNPLTDEANDWRGITDYAWSHAIVSDETHQIILQNCNFESKDRFNNKTCRDALFEMYAQYKHIDITSLYTPTCFHKNKTNTGNKFSTQMMRRMVAGYVPCLNNHAHLYYNRHDVQKALHVISGSQHRKWSLCNYDILHGWTDYRASVLSSYLKLLEAGHRIWVYSGDTDGQVPVLSTRYSLNALGLRKGPWRPWYYSGQVGGWTQDYGNLTFATFRGAGQAVPIFNRGKALFFLNSFLSRTPLPKSH